VAHTGEYVLAAVGAVLVAGALLYLMMLGTPQPGMFFGWIIALATLAAVVYPFSTGAPLQQKAATAIVNLVLGVAMGTLLNAVAARAVRYRYVRPPAGRTYERDPYDREHARDPYDRERDPYDREHARDPYAREPYARDRYERDRYERDRYERDRYGRDRYERDHPPTQPMDYPPSRTPGDY
jgi:hypothetical protein